MNKKIVIPIAAVAALLVAGFFWFDKDKTPTNELTLHGNVDIRQVELAFNANGRISGIEVREGDRVKAGQLLARLDTERLRLSLQQAEAQVAAQQQVVKRYEAGSRPEEIRQARAQREAARVSMDDADNFYRRQQSLVARNFISQQQADNARFALDKARAQWQAANETARLAELGPRREDTAAARATLNANEAATAQLRRDISEGELRAPSDGLIEKRILEVGDMASPQKSVFTLVLTEPLWVRVWLPETQLGRIPVGARATVHTDSHPEKTYRAWIGYVSPSSEFTPKSVETSDIRSGLVYQTRVFVCEGAGELRQGMPATVRISLDQPPAAQGESPCQDGNPAR
jgi:HlyD family secretion protein